MKDVALVSKVHFETKKKKIEMESVRDFDTEFHLQVIAKVIRIITAIDPDILNIEVGQWRIF